MGVREQFEADAARLRDAAERVPETPVDPRWAAVIPVLLQAWAETAALLGEHGVPTAVVDGRDVWEMHHPYNKVYLTSDGQPWVPAAVDEHRPGRWPPKPVVLQPLTLQPVTGFGMRGVASSWRLDDGGNLLAYVKDDIYDRSVFIPLDQYLAQDVRERIRTAGRSGA